jgi:hypothetical protein
LNSRVLIEQAKGVLAERLHLDVAEAFTVLRSGARSHSRRLSELAQAIVDGSEQIPPARVTSQPGQPEDLRLGHHRVGGDLSLGHLGENTSNAMMRRSCLDNWP